MTHRTEIAFTTPRRHGWKDTAVVAFLMIVLGAFVAQLVKPPPQVDSHQQAAASETCRGAHC